MIRKLRIEGQLIDQLVEASNICNRTPLYMSPEGLPNTGHTTYPTHLMGSNPRLSQQPYTGPLALFEESPVTSGRPGASYRDQAGLLGREQSVGWAEIRAFTAHWQPGFQPNPCSSAD